MASSKTAGDTGPSAQTTDEARKPETPETKSDSKAKASKKDAGAKPESDADAAPQSGTRDSGNGDATTDTNSEVAAKDGDTPDNSAKPGADKKAAGEGGQNDAGDAASEQPEAPLTADDEPEETLDLRALFASSEPDFASPPDTFASPTETFEMARGAKAESRSTTRISGLNARQGGEARDPVRNDPDLPLDLPENAVLNDSAASGDSAASETDSPGSAFSDMFGAAGNADTGSGESDDHQNAFDSGNPGDPLADAVQSALRSVYGDDGQSEDEYAKGEEQSEGGGAGPVLQWAGSGASQQTDETFARDHADHFDPGDIDEPEPDTGIDEETTEAVLSYLYEHVDSDADGDTSATASNGSRPGNRGDVYAGLDTGERLSDDAWVNRARTADHGEPHAAGPRLARTPDTAGSEPSLAATLQGFNTPDRRQPSQSTGRELVATSPPFGMDANSGEASGKLLGAAGLTLIGGIAVAGVAAVFVFNSLVTQNDGISAREQATAGAGDSTSQSAANAGGKSDARLGSTATETASSTETSGETMSRTGTDEAAQPAQTAALTQGADQNASGETSDNAGITPPISASSASGRADQAIPLGLSVPKSDGERFVRIDGLPEGVRLSAGVDTGNGSWLLSARRAEGLALTAPDAFSGAFTLRARLLGADARTPLSDSVAFEVSVAEAASPESVEGQSPALAPETAPIVADQPPPAVDRARSLMQAGDVLAAREILRVEAESGNAEAALAMGESFDPMTFTELNAANANPDATAAFKWYQRASNLGEPRGQTKMTDLKTWLLR